MNIKNILKINDLFESREGRNNVGQLIKRDRIAGGACDSDIT